MEITREDILHLAELSSLSLSEEEISSLGENLKDIIKYISELKDLDTAGLEPTYQVFEMENIWRKDEILAQDATREELLETAPDSYQDQIKVPKVL